LVVESKTIREVRFAISLTEAALAQCDKSGLVLPAIDLSSALDKLQAIQATLESSQPDNLMIND